MAKRSKSPKKHPLFHDGAGRVPGAVYGMLRSSYNQTANTADGFVAGKLMVADRAAADWRPQVAGYDVLIPHHAPTLWRDPRELWTAYEGARLSRQRDLAICITAYLEAARSLHDGWEQVRAWTYEVLVKKRSLAATLALHVPSTAGSSNAPHVHVIATARQALAWGFGTFADETTDETLKALALDLVQHRERWIQ
jgi:hypothetical protein